MKITTIAIAAAIVAVTAGSASAGTPGIDLRQNLQKHRIYNGVATGQVSYGESQSLVAGQSHVRNLKTQARTDGVVTGWERARIHLAQNTQNRRIFRMKHN